MPLDRVTLQFSAGSGISSRLIEWFGHNAPYSHVDLVLPDGRLMGSRTDHPVNGMTGVQIRPANYADWKRKLVVSIPTPRADDIYAWGKTQLGAPYDRMAIVAFLFNRNWKDEGAWYCSEYGTACFVRGGYWDKPWALPCPLNKIDPPTMLLLFSPVLIVVEKWPL